jgi:hypothetical protein
LVVPTGKVAVVPEAKMDEAEVTIVAILLKSPLTIKVVGEPWMTPRGAGRPDPAMRISFVKRSNTVLRSCTISSVTRSFV